jgi:hypothetical protein
MFVAGTGPIGAAGMAAAMGRARRWTLARPRTVGASPHAIAPPSTWSDAVDHSTECSLSRRSCHGSGPTRSESAP